MTIILKNKDTLTYREFIFKCSIGKNGISKNKFEGDKKTPMGMYEIGNLYYRKDRLKKPYTKIKSIPLKKNMGWCDDPDDKKNYNKLIKIKRGIRCERLFKKNKNYDLLIPIKYNTKKIIYNRGSAIFIHLTNNYKPTLGCISLKKRDFLILLKLIDKRTKIRIS